MKLDLVGHQHRTHKPKSTGGGDDLIREDRRFTLSVGTAQLGISYGSTHAIVYYDMG